MELAERRIVLTGAASGIGLALLGELARRPNRILAADRDAAGLGRALADLAGAPAQIWPCVVDLAAPEGNDRLLDEAWARMGGVDLLFANAGFAYYERLGAPSWEHLERIYRLNVFAPIYAAQRLRELSAGRPYTVVITASAMARVAVPGYALYASTKAALDRFAEAYRYELAPPSRLVLVYPIGTRTGFFARAGRAIPRPWPTQSAQAVAQAVLRGVARGQESIYPARLWHLAWALGRAAPAAIRAYQRHELAKLRRWAGEGRAPD